VSAERRLRTRDWAEWAIAAFVAVSLWLGPPALLSIYSIAVGTYVLVRGPQWARLWLVTILGTVLVMLGIVYALVLIIE